MTAEFEKNVRTLMKRTGMKKCIGKGYINTVFAYRYQCSLNNIYSPMELTSVFFWYVSLYNFLIQFFLWAFSFTFSNLLQSWPFDPIHIWTLPSESWSSFTMVTVMYSILVLEKTADYFNLWWTVPPIMYCSKIKLIHLPVHWSILRFKNLNYEKKITISLDYTSFSKI